MSKRWILSVHKMLWAAGIILVAALVLNIGWVTLYSQFEVGTTAQMFLYKFESVENDKETKDLKIEYQWIPLDSMSRNIIVATLAAEDKNFYIHDGFAPIETSDDTLAQIMLEERKTITQKAVHAVFLTNGDSGIKDALEAYYTLMAEYLWGKNRTLEIYLNTVLLGDGIFGVEAASQIYFGKHAGQLTKQEAVWIAAMMDSSGRIDIDNPSSELKLRQRAISLEMGLMMHIKIGKLPVDDKNPSPAKPIYRRQWKG